MKNNKMRRLFVLATVISVSFLLLAACGGGDKPANPSPQPSKPDQTTSPAISPEVANPGEAAVQKLLGRWDGPEGTYLNVTEKMDENGKQQLPRKFTVEIKNLDKAETFEGTANSSGIDFVRKSKTETIKAATGAETGMKWLEKETNCVVVTKGSEGFCKKAADAPAASPTASPAKK